MAQKKTITEEMHWLDSVNVNSNKKLTAVSRETFVILYRYRSWEKSISRFSQKNAKVLSFFVESLPDWYLSMITRSLNAYQAYIADLHNHRKESHKLDDHDRLIIDSIFSIYRVEDYEKSAAHVTDKYGYYLPYEYVKFWNSHDFTQLDRIAVKNNLENPIELIAKEDGNLYLRSGAKDVYYRPIAVPKIAK